MYSPRSVSTTVNPAASIAWSSADSSATIDFYFMIFFTSCFVAISRTSALISAGVSAKRTVAPRAVAFTSNSSSQTSRFSSARLRTSFACSRVPSKSSSSLSAARRLPPNLPCIFLRFACNRASCSLTWARSLKCIDVTCMDEPRILAARAAPSIGTASGQHFGDVQHLGLRIAAPAQPALDVQHAAQIAQHDGVRARGLDVPAFVVGQPRRNLAELDRERPAEAAARLALRHLLDGETRDF